MATGMLYLNGVDAETIGFTPVSATGLLGSAARTLGLLDIPGVPGAIDPGVSPAEATRTIQITGLVMAASVTALYTSLDAINDACGTGLVEIRSAYSTSRAFYGVLEPFDAEQTANVANVMVDGYALVSLSFLCAMPYAVALVPSVINFRSTATDIPLGTASSVGRDTGWSAMIEITGAATTPTLTYSNYRGDTVSTMAFASYSPLAGDSILVDCGRRLVYKFVSGVRTNIFSVLTAGYAFPALDPSDADFTNSLWPKLTCSSGSAVIRYYKAYR